MKKDWRKKFSYFLTINEIDTNTRKRLYYTKNGASLWDWLATRGYVALIPYDGYGYFYRFSRLKEGMEKAAELGLTKKGGLFYDDIYFYSPRQNTI